MYHPRLLNLHDSITCYLYCFAFQSCRGLCFNAIPMLNLWSSLSYVSLDCQGILINKSRCLVLKVHLMEYRSFLLKTSERHSLFLLSQPFNLFIDLASSRLVQQSLTWFFKLFSQLESNQKIHPCSKGTLNNPLYITSRTLARSWHYLGSSVPLCI